VNLVFEDGP